MLLWLAATCRTRRNIPVFLFVRLHEFLVPIKFCQEASKCCDCYLNNVDITHLQSVIKFSSVFLYLNTFD